MNLQFRAFAHRDLEEIVQVSLLGLEPVFISFRKILGPAIYNFLYPDWHEGQKEALEATCKDKEEVNVLVAELGKNVVGFLAYELKSRIGEVLYWAVHPGHQNLGIGTALNSMAFEKMQTAG